MIQIVRRKSWTRFLGVRRWDGYDPQTGERFLWGYPDRSVARARAHLENAHRALIRALEERN